MNVKSILYMLCSENNIPISLVEKTTKMVEDKGGLREALHDDSFISDIRELFPREGSDSKTIIQEVKI